MKSLDFQNEDERGMIKLIESSGYDEANLLKKLKVERLGSSDFIQIAFESESPYLSAAVVNAVATEFLKYYDASSSQKANASVAYYTELAEQKKKELDEKVNSLKIFKQQNGVINIYEQTKSLVNQISDLELSREAENKRISSSSKAVKDIDNRFSDKDRKYLEAGNTPYSKNIAILKQKVSDYSNHLISKGYTAQEINDSLKVLKNTLDAEIKKASDEFLYNPDVPKQELVTKRIDYELDLVVAKYSVESMDKELSRLRQIVISFAPIEASIAALEREITVAADVYLLVLNKLNLAKIDNVAAGTIKQIEMGIPGQPEASKKILLIIMAGFISFILCIVVIFVLEYLDVTIKTPKQFVKYTNLNLLGYLNLLEEGKIDLNSIFNETTAKYDIKAETFKELLRIIRYELSQKMGDAKSLLVTSTRSGEGKSLIISCLAYSFAITGKKVLILDTNFKNNTLTKLFKADANIESYLKGELSLQNAITETSVANIDIIGCKGANNKFIGAILNKVTMDNLEQIYGEPLKVKNINTELYNPDNDVQNIRQELGYSENDVIVLFIARLTYQKDPLTFINAAKIVLDKVPDAKIMIIGEGELRKDCSELSSILKIKDKIKFLPFRKDVKNILYSTDIYVLPSLWEVVPLALLEAMAMKKACIATNIKGTNEALKDGFNGLMFGTGNFVELADKIITLINNKETRIKFGETARETVVRQFDLKKLVKENEQVYSYMGHF
ncbi:unnamed protein product [Rotaria sp. Silwood1]|nr:unnamed protein product [Rotaria sp. Silwood1]